jgi:tetratricopeptide (TPR) repeat protein
MKKYFPPHEYLLFFLICSLLLYGNTLFHDFVLDDAIAITQNIFTQKGFSGIWEQLTNDQFVGFFEVKKKLISGGRYRPLSFIVFNVLYEFFGQNPFPYHLLNVLVYGFSGYLLYQILSELWNKSEFTTSWISVPLWTTLIWFFHPLHTEVVANIKGLDEILAFLLVLLSLKACLNYLQNKQPLPLALAFVYFFLALLAKESAITWLAVIPLIIYFFRPEQLKNSLSLLGVLLVSGLLWFGLRYKIVGAGLENVADNLMNDPFLESSSSEKYATIMYTLGKYLQLLFFPHPLTYDYYPKHIPIVGWNNPVVILSTLAYLSLAVIAILGLKKKSLYAFGIAYYLITLSIVSNIVFPIGAFMNERFLYAPSLGFAVILVYFLLKNLPEWMGGWYRSRNTVIGIFSVILFLYAVKTISRNLDWKDNLTLATHDAQISVRGAKSNVMAGGLLSEKAAQTTDQLEKKRLLQESNRYLNQALTVYPEYVDALLLMGNVQWELTQDSRYALPYYQRILSINSSHENAWQNIFVVLEQEKRVDQRIKSYEMLMQYGQRQAQLYLNLGRAYGKDKGNLAKSIQLMEKGLNYAPNHYELLTNLGTAYGLTQQYQKAIQVLERAIAIRPKIAKTYVDLGLSYFYAGRTEEARQAFDKAVSLDASIDRNQFPV